MDYKDFKLQKNSQEEYFWYKARKKLILNLLSREFKKREKQRLILDILNLENNKFLLGLPKPWGLSIYGIAQKKIDFLKNL